MTNEQRERFEAWWPTAVDGWTANKGPNTPKQWAWLAWQASQPRPTMIAGWFTAGQMRAYVDTARRKTCPTR